MENELTNEQISGVESLLCERIQKEERQIRQKEMLPNSLWSHSHRVASLTEKIGKAEGVDPIACRLAGLFHDAGKFHGGRYHQGVRPEEEHSVDVFLEIAVKTGIQKSVIEMVSQSIKELYAQHSNPSLLTKVLFDADNLDKLGYLGAANFFLKAGLRGQGISQALLYRITVELTYARHASKCFATETGRGLALLRAPQTVEYFKTLLDSLRLDGLYDFRVNKIHYNGLIIDAVTPVACECGHPIQHKIWEQEGIKCSEIHLEFLCYSCSQSHELKFCRPRLLCACIEAK